MNFPILTAGTGIAVSLLLLSTIATPEAEAQNRDFQTQRVLLDDGSGNTITVQTPLGLGADFTLTLPASSGTIMTTGAAINANEVLFGGAGGALAQNVNFVYDPTTDILNLGAGNFTVDAPTGNTSIAGTLNVSGVVTGNGSGLTNLDATDLTGDVPTTSLTNVFTAINTSASLIDADNIGNGLTNTQVNDDLTITGGSISNTPISGNTGSFTTISGTALPASSSSTNIVVSNVGALETRTIASLNEGITVATGPTLSGNGLTATPLAINLANANAWTGAQTFSSVDVNGGTIDGAAVGSASASTGAFTTLTTTGSITVNDGGNADLVITEGGFDRSSPGAEVIRLNNSAATGTVDILINGATQTTNSRLTVNDGHWTTQGTVPTIAATVGFTAGVSITANSTDVAGSVSATTGGTGTANSTMRVTFNRAYATAPIVLITPSNANAGTRNYYVAATSTTTFDITIPSPGNGQTHTFNYHVIESQ